MGPAPWAILDFPGPEGTPIREVFRDPVAVIDVRWPHEVRPALDEVERRARSGLTMVGFVAYEAAPGLEPRFEVRSGYEGPLIYFLAFGAQTDPRVASEGALREDGTWNGVWTLGIKPERHRKKVERIVEGIARGDYYQVNLTERFSATIDNPLAVYERLRRAQSAKYSAYVETAEMAALSVSPELFLHRAGDMIESRPMKGTSRRGRWSDEDDRLELDLATSEKDRAENLMIVDLIRNDMGRVAVTGSVEVPAMLTIEKYPTVIQMTSHVRSQVKPGTSLGDIFAALFPCGSITGAPKIAASRAIATLEETPRGVYCGAVGVIRPGGTDFTFNVAIRTGTVSHEDGRAIYGAGGGITADSRPSEEFLEMLAKAAVLTSVPREIELLETLRLDTGSVPRLDGHMRRLSRSARYFDFRRIDEAIAEIRSAIVTEAAANPAGLFRLRVLLRPDGSHDLTRHNHADETRPRRLALSSMPLDNADPYLYHKVADRSLYATRMTEAGAADDVILVNESGQLTETTIGNLVLELDGRRITPSIDCGLLPGVFRQALLESGEIEEGILHPDDLKKATRAWMVNSLRGWVDAEIVDRGIEG
jgi:para-aminobenzoate synthetase / 4-amino-4-deoxychorismate lyase